MRKVIYSVFFLSGLAALTLSCNNGEYSANPDSPINGGINPLKPLKKEEFTWGGSADLEADIDGQHFVADTSSWYLDSAGTNVFVGTKKDSKKSIVFYLKDVYAVNLYPLSYHVYTTQAIYVDQVDSVKQDLYFSYMGNSGQVLVNRNDSAFLEGKFYFQGVSVDGKVVTVNKGAFNIKKPL